MMIYDIISDTLEKRGFVQSSGNPETAEFFIKVTEDKIMHICSIVKNIRDTHITADIVSESTKQLERKFLLSGYNDVKVMNIIVTDKQEDVAKLEEDGTKFWVVDIRSARLMIFEKQPEDYFGIRKKLEEAIIGHPDENKDSETSWILKGNIPYITVGLILVNVLIFIICEIVGSTEDVELMINMGALGHDFIYEDHEYYRFITSMFLHFGFMHLANNMFMLAIVGSQLENAIGHLRFVLIYVISGLGAGIASVVFHMLLDESVVAAGASGAIYGVFGAMLIMIIRNRHDEFMVKRILIVVFLLVFGSIQEEIDFAAHVGGLVVGMISGFALGMANKETAR